MAYTVPWTQGLPCEDVVYDAETWEWVFRFEPGVTLRVAAPWRIIAEGHIALGHGDHGQQFGLPRPVDGAARALELLRGRPVAKFSTSAVSADACIDFGSGLLLEIFNSSAGYEGWTLLERGGRQIVAQGGGNLVEIPASGR